MRGGVRRLLAARGVLRRRTVRLYPIAKRDSTRQRGSLGRARPRGHHLNKMVPGVAPAFFVDQPTGASPRFTEPDASAFRLIMGPAGTRHAWGATGSASASPSNGVDDAKHWRSQWHTSHTEPGRWLPA
jgi:hypothetical protein